MDYSDIVDMVDALLSNTDSLISFLESNFITALAGAFCGAWAAQKSAEKDNHKRRIIDEIRNTNAATMASFGIANAYIGLKKQHVRNLLSDYQKQTKERENFIAAQQAKKIPLETPFHYEANFHTIYSVHTSIDTLQSILFEKLSVSGHPIALVMALKQSIDNVNSSIEARNAFIKECQSGAISNHEIACAYFGVMNQNRRVDQRYPTSLNAISFSTDECIFFSTQLCAALEEHAKELKEQFGKKSPKIVKIDFSKSKDADLLPAEDDFKDWFPPPPIVEAKWWKRAFTKLTAPFS
jgi:hypothetical protein